MANLNLSTAFAINDQCFVLAYGVGKITTRDVETFEGQQKEYWNVEFTSGALVKVPVGEENQHMRRIISPYQAKNLLDQLLQPDIPPDKREFAHRAETWFKSITETGLDPNPMTKCLRELYAMETAPSFGEKKHILRFQDLVVEEIACALGQATTDIISKLRQTYPVAHEGILEP